MLVAQEASAQATGPGTVLFSDDFSDPENGQLPQTSTLPDQYQRFYDSGDYVIQKLDPTWNRVPEAQVPGIYDDAAISVSVRITGDTNNRFAGVVCRVQPTTNSSEYRLVVIPATRRFLLERWDDATEVSLVGWQTSTAIQPGNSTNQVQLACAGNVISATINGTLVASKADATYSSGAMRIAAGSLNGANGPTEARFGSLVVSQAAPLSVAQTPPAVPAPVAETSYTTPNGPRTATQIRDELTRAGYGGPWDIASMLAAYNAAAAPPPAPTQVAPSLAQPTPVLQPRQDFTPQCQAFADSLPNRIDNKVLNISNTILGCTFYANRDGSAGLACFESVLQRELTDAIIYSTSDFDSRYHDCLGH